MITQTVITAITVIYNGLESSDYSRWSRTLILLRVLNFMYLGQF